MNITPAELQSIVGSIQKTHGPHLMALATFDNLCANLIHENAQSHGRTATTMQSVLKACVMAYLSENDIDPVAYRLTLDAIGRAGATVAMIESLPD